MDGCYLSLVVPRVMLLLALRDNAAKLPSRVSLQAWQSLRAALEAVEVEVLRGLPHHESDLKKLVKLALAAHASTTPATAHSALLLKQLIAKLKANGITARTSVGAALARFLHAMDTHLLSLLHTDPSVGAVVEVLAGSLPPLATDAWGKLLASFSPKVQSLDQQLGVLTIGLILMKSLSSRLQSAAVTISRGLRAGVAVQDRIFYATNRPDLSFLIEPFTLREEGSLDAIWYGVVDVSISEPEVLEDFEPTSPDNVELTGVFSNLYHDHPSFIQTLNSYLAELDKQAGSTTPTADVVIYVHGFSTPFVDDIRRSAQLKHDMKLFGAIIGFSWPSVGKGSVEAYQADEAAAEAAKPFLASFISLCMTEVNARRLHIIAHSMGNRVLIGAMRQLYSEIGAAGDGGWMGMGLPLKNIISAAGDEIPAELQAMVDEAKLVFGEDGDPNDEHRPLFTVYTSTDDIPLLFSVLMHDGAKRVGLTESHFDDGMSTISDTGFVDVIDCSNYPPKSLHMYFATEKDLIQDMHDLFSVSGKERAYLRSQGDTNLAKVSHIDSETGKQFEFYSFSPASWQQIDTLT